MPPKGQAAPLDAGGLRESDLRPRREFRELAVKVVLEEALFRDVVTEAVGKVFDSDALQLPGFSLPTGQCWFASLGSGWRKSVLRKPGSNRREALERLYGELKSLLQRLGAVERAELERKRQLINELLRRSETNPRLRPAALAAAEVWNLAKYARRVATGKWSLAFEVRARGGRLVRRDWTPAKPRLSRQADKPRPKRPAESEPRASRRNRLCQLGPISSAELEPVPRGLGFRIELPTPSLGVLRLSGFVDSATVGTLELAFGRVYKRGARWAIVVMQELQYVNSTGLGCLVKHRQQFQKRGGDVVLVGAGPKLRKVIELLGLDQVLPLAADLDAALALAGMRRKRRRAPRRRAVAV